MSDYFIKFVTGQATRYNQPNTMMKKLSEYADRIHIAFSDRQTNTLHTSSPHEWGFSAVAVHSSLSDEPVTITLNEEAETEASVDRNPSSTCVGIITHSEQEQNNAVNPALLPTLTYREMTIPPSSNDDCGWMCTKGRLFYIRDRNYGHNFFVNIGAEISVLPPDLQQTRSIQVTSCSWH